MAKFVSSRRRQVGIEFEGGPQLYQQFDRIVEQVQGETLAAAAKAGAEIVAAAARVRAPVDKGVLKQNIVVKKSGKVKPRRAAFTVGPNRAAAHGIPLELGHNIVRGGKNVGHVAARPYLRPAIDETRTEVTNAVRDIMQSGILKAING